MVGAKPIGGGALAPQAPMVATALVIYIFANTVRCCHNGVNCTYYLDALVSDCQNMWNARIVAVMETIGYVLFAIERPPAHSPQLVSNILLVGVGVEVGLQVWAHGYYTNVIFCDSMLTKNDGPGDPCHAVISSDNDIDLQHTVQCMCLCIVQCLLRQVNERLTVQLYTA